MSTAREVAEAFSGHRFADAHPHLAEAVREAWEGTLSELTGATTEFVRFLVVDGGEAVAVDAIGRYTAADGSVSLVSSCDLYEFREDVLVTITSYTVELDALPS